MDIRERFSHLPIAEIADEVNASLASHPRLVVTARTHDEPYSMWCRKLSCLLWEITPADMLSSYNTGHISRFSYYLYITVIDGKG